MRINKSVVLTFSICGNVPQFQCSVMATRNLKERQKRRIAGHCKGTIQATFTHMHYTRTIALTKTLHHHTPHTTHHTPHTGTHHSLSFREIRGSTDTVLMSHKQNLNMGWRREGEGERGKAEGRQQQRSRWTCDTDHISSMTILGYTTLTRGLWSCTDHIRTALSFEAATRNRSW